MQTLIKEHLGLNSLLLGLESFENFYIFRTKTWKKVKLLIYSLKYIVILCLQYISLTNSNKTLN